ncbi:RluA family pseudouridine synthase [Acidimicrobiales bacterium]|jgi:23S rRNA pseudouridine1911/1915/1917 synthase|nr:RluA family pseudouridine synthase [Acidimicrobiales bacterium]
MTTRTDVVPAGFDGERLDRFVAALSELSRSVATRLVKSGDVFVDGVPATRPSGCVAEGQRVDVAMPDDVDVTPQPDPSIEITVVFEDDAVIVIDKPAGLVVHPGAGNKDGTLVNGLVARFPEIADVGEVHRPGIVHRLDRGTSGLLVVARTQNAYLDLVEQMSSHEPSRIYEALSWGLLETEAGTIDAPIGRSVRHPTRNTVTKSGRRAVTHYQVRDRYELPKPVTLIRCELETGRTHQIRVHLRAIGHPVVGDREYDGGRPGIDPGRPFLHAEELRFRHPVTAEKVVAISPRPSDLEACLAGLR